MAAMRFEQVQRFILAKKFFGVRCTLMRFSPLSFSIMFFFCQLWAMGTIQCTCT